MTAEQATAYTGLIGAVATAAVAIIHAVASGTVQIIRAWKNPVTSKAEPKATVIPAPKLAIPAPQPKVPTP